MKRLLSIILLLSLAAALAVNAKVPPQVTRAVSRVKAAPALNVEFTVNGQAGSATLCGQMFTYQFPMASVFYDGKTQWSYSPADKEVTIFNPTAAELAESNPLQILSRLASDYSGTALPDRPNTVRLSALNPKNPVTEATVVFNPSTGWPTEITIICGNQRTHLENIRFTPSKTTKAPETFKFKAPKGTTINDLR
ncbi:MAG: hypothetical protein K2L05_06380 [Muribaculaceae bacterium]|nr:hypothetical protein [Muribaculaceae bacterium]